MILLEAINQCKVRGYIAREFEPNKKYWKNVSEPFIYRIPAKDIFELDWKCYDPESEETSIMG
jgi:hypothetical protein